MILAGTMTFFIKDHYSVFSFKLWTIHCDGTLCWTLILQHLLYLINIINVPPLQTPTNHLAKLQRANQWREAVEFSHHRHDSRWVAWALVQQRSQPSQQTLFTFAGEFISLIRIMINKKNDLAFLCAGCLSHYRWNCCASQVGFTKKQKKVNDTQNMHCKST